jgi:hypothetical protein
LRDIPRSPPGPIWFESLFDLDHQRISKIKLGNHKKMNEAREDLFREIENLKEELKERELSLPAHSVRPHLIIEELENKIHELEERVRHLDSGKVSKEGK